MEVQYYGANCVKITSKKFSIVVDDNLAKLGLKSIVKEADVLLSTSKELIGTKASKSRFLADTPGEYEISGAIIHGVGTRAHIDDENHKSSVIYTISSDDAKIAIIGHIYPDLSEEQLEAIGMVDVVIIPVGGNGYTLDGAGALKIIKKIEPKLVIPTHYADKGTKYEVPQVELSDALKGLGMEVSEELDKIKINHSELSDSTKLVVLKKQQ